MEEHVVVAVEVLYVDDVSVDAVSPCVVELVAGLTEDTVDAAGDDSVVVVEGPVVVHEDGDCFRHNTFTFILVIIDNNQ